MTGESDSRSDVPRRVRDRAARWVGIGLGVLLLLFLATVARDDAPTPMLGVYTWGHEVNTYRSCGGTEVRWVQAPERILEALRRAHDSLAAEPYGGILVEAHLRHSGAEPDGFALDYDGLIRIDSTRLYRTLSNLMS